MQVEFIRRWVDALRSGEYKQVKYWLHNRDGFCAVGVACDVYEPSWTAHVPSDSFTWDPRVRTLIRVVSGLSCHQMGEIRKMNDSDGATFLEIADYIEGLVENTECLERNESPRPMEVVAT